MSQKIGFDPDGVVIGSPEVSVKVGSASTDLAGFHGRACAQAALVTNTSGTLGNTNAALTAVITALVSKGILAAS